MDISKLTGALLSADSISGLSSLADVSGKDVNSVLTAVLPALLNGANNQAKGKDTTEGFAQALAQHSKADTKDVKGFLGNVDLEDGAKIIGHLLGSQKTDVTTSVVQQTGVSSDKTTLILSAVGPLLMSLLGQQADEDENKSSGVEALLGMLLENVDLTELLTGTSSNESNKKDDDKKEESGSALGSIMSGLFKLLK